MAKYKCPSCGRPCESSAGCFLHKPKKALPKTGKVFERKKNIERMDVGIYSEEKMWELFLRIWKERGPWSEIDDSYLGSEPLTIFFDHLLPKETFKEIMYEDWNILLVSWEQHDQRHFGIPHPKHKEAIERAKEVYNNLFSNC